MSAETVLAVEDLRLEDEAQIVAIDRILTGTDQSAWWHELLPRYVGSDSRRLGLAVRMQGQLVGYLLAEVRAFEFGSEPCGWIFTVGVHPDAGHEGVGSRLSKAACEHFQRLGIYIVRTMVRREDVPLLAFFRRNGFIGGPFQQLELRLPDQPDAEDPARPGRTES